MKQVIIRIGILLIYAMLNVSCMAQHEEFAPLFKCTKKLNNSYGVCTHINVSGDRWEYDTRGQDVAMIKSTGATMLRTDFFWLNMTRNSYSTMSYKLYDSMLKTVDSLQMGTLGIITLHDGYVMSEKEKWNHYLTHTVEHYRQMEYWEILNEVDMSSHWGLEVSALDYAVLLKSGYNAVKKVSKRKKVLFSGLANTDSEFLDSVFSAGVNNYFDIMNAHRYNHKKDEPESLLDYYKRLNKKLDKYLVNKPLWLTECGCSTAEGWITEETQAIRLPRIFLISFACGVDKVFWYKSRSREMNPADPEDYFGLWHKDYTPKPAYYAYQTLTKMCPNKSVRPLLRKQGDVYIALWNRPDGKRIYALWTSKDKETVSLLAKGKYECFDINGMAISVSGNQIDASPSILYFMGDRTFEMTLGE